MSLIPTIYSSSDPGAPTLTGQAGSLVALLDAILVNGYGVGPTAKGPLGWTVQHSATNKRAYRGSLTTGTGYVLRVDDTNGRYGLLRGYSSMSDIDTGVDPTPTVADRADGILWPKSNTLDATTRRWWAIGNERCLYLFNEVNVRPDGHADGPPFFFGDIISNKPNDGHQFAISSTPLTSYTGGSVNQSNLFWNTGQLTTNPTVTSSPLIVGRPMSGAAGSVPLHMTSILGEVSATVGGGTMPYPIYDGGPMVYERVRLHESGRIPRGRMPGIFGHSHARPFSELSTEAGLLNKNFRAYITGNLSGLGQVFFETGAEWQ